jgi:1-acyl-sn-glycerol-3-phosphate acyltransferase
MTACAPIAKSEVGSWPLIGACARNMGVILVERDNVYSRAHALRQAMTRLREGINVLNFPEGTTTDGSHVLPFQCGIFGIAQLSEVPVIPIGLDFHDSELCWTGDATFLPHYLKTAARAKNEITLRFGKPLYPAPFESAEGFAGRARASVLRLSRTQDETAIDLRVPSPRPDAVLSATGSHG